MSIVVGVVVLEVVGSITRELLVPRKTSQTLFGATHLARGIAGRPIPKIPLKSY